MSYVITGFLHAINGLYKTFGLCVIDQSFHCSLAIYFLRDDHCSAYNCLEDSRKRKAGRNEQNDDGNAAAMKDSLPGPSQPRPPPKKTFFQFPSDPALQKIWVAKLNLVDFRVKAHSRLCQDHFEENRFEVGPKLIASLGLEGIKRPSLKRDAIPTIFDKGSPKASRQVTGKKIFKRSTAKRMDAKFQSKFSPSLGSPKKLSPKKRYGAFAKRRRLEVSKNSSLVFIKDF